jgi:hypothetical protein
VRYFAERSTHTRPCVFEERKQHVAYYWNAVANTAHTANTAKGGDEAPVGEAVYNRQLGASAYIGGELFGGYEALAGDERIWRGIEVEEDVLTH